MCISLKIIIKNTFFCCTDISQPFWWYFCARSPLDQLYQTFPSWPIALITKMFVNLPHGFWLSSTKEKLGKTIHFARIVFVVWNYEERIILALALNVWFLWWLSVYAVVNTFSHSVLTSVSTVPKCLITWIKKPLLQKSSNANVSELKLRNFNLLSSNLKKWSDTLKYFAGCCQQLFKCVWSFCGVWTLIVNKGIIRLFAWKSKCNFKLSNPSVNYRLRITQHRRTRTLSELFYLNT